MNSEILYLKKDAFSGFVDALRRDYRIIAPVQVSEPSGRKAADYREYAENDSFAFDGPLPRRSLKEFFLPPTEALMHWQQNKGNVSIEPVDTYCPPTVILGAYPCDAAAIPILDRVMDWDYRDDPWFNRRKASTIITRACPVRDSSCFCTTVGLSPHSTKGSDILLTPAENNEDHHVEIISPKGAELISRYKDFFEASPDADYPAGLREKASSEASKTAEADPAKIESWIKKNFDNPLWTECAERCHGCGACAAVCPTCHCFDIIDEPEGIDRGTRRRNWDTCQTSLFTLHGSGHNPRTCQSARIRQRVMHKFHIYPERFREILCTGCGRCSRICAAGMDLPEILRLIDSTASLS